MTYDARHLRFSRDEHGAVKARRRLLSGVTQPIDPDFDAHYDDLLYGNARPWFDVGSLDTLTPSNEYNNMRRLYNPRKRPGTVAREIAYEEKVANAASVNPADMEDLFGEWFVGFKEPEK
jgi:hypothetical protein